MCAGRKRDRTRALAVLLCYAGVGSRPSCRILSGLEDVSREAVRKWFHRFKEVLPEPKRKVRRPVAIDETKLRIENVHWFVWAGIDLDNGEVLATHLSRGRGCMDTLTFLKKVSRTCRNRPLVYMDRGPRYPWALERYGFPFEQVTWGNRNPIEGWFSVLEQIPPRKLLRISGLMADRFHADVQRLEVLSCQSRKDHKKLLHIVFL